MKILEKINNIQNKINQEVEILKDPITHATAKVDGIVNVEKYLQSNIRIMWVLKEVNASEDGEEWNMIDTIKDWTGKPIPTEWRKTFDNILYVTNGILTSTAWEDQNNHYNDLNMTSQLQEIAYCNVKKIPGNSSTNMSNLKKYYKQSDKHILKQINELIPQVIIFGGTYDIVEPDLDIMHYSDHGDKNLSWYSTKDQIIINAYHPQNTSISHQEYCDGIINAVLEWKSRMD